MAAVIFFQRRFFLGTAVMVEALLMICQSRLWTEAREFRNVVARINLFNSAKGLAISNSV
jgi:hypothetical protein